MHVQLVALRRGRLPQLQELHPDAGERHSCPLRPRRLVRRLGHEQGMAATVIGRMGGSRSHGPLRREQSLEHAEFREAVARQIEPEPAPADPVECIPVLITSL